MGACIPGKGMPVSSLNTVIGNYWKIWNDIRPGTLLNSAHVPTSIEGSISNLRNHTSLTYVPMFNISWWSTPNPVCLHYRMPFSIKCPRSSLGWLGFTKSVLSPTYPLTLDLWAMSSITQEGLLPLNEHHFPIQRPGVAVSAGNPRVLI